MRAVSLVCRCFLIIAAVSANFASANEVVDVGITKRLLIVVHASTALDRHAVAKHGIDRVEKRFERGPDAGVIHVHQMKGSGDGVWYPEEIHPDRIEISPNGSLALETKATEITVVGGYFGLCHQRATLSLIDRSRSDSPLKIFYPMEAIYTLPELAQVQTSMQKPVMLLSDAAQSLPPEAFIDRFLENMRMEGGTAMEWDRLFGTDGTATLELFLDGIWQRRLGSGPRRVELHLTIHDKRAL